VDTLKERPALSEFKDIITKALNADDSKLLQALRKGAFSKTWWENEEEFAKEASDNWRT
jgi:hypothetical protein